MKRTILSILILFWISASLFAAEPRVAFEDKFDTKLGDGWTWLRENPKTWRIRDGGLEIRVEPGLANNVKNALLRPAPARSKTAYAVEATVTFTAPPTNQFEQAGITWYQKGQPVFKFVHEHIDGKDYIIPGKVPAPENTVRLRLLVANDKYTAQFQPAAKGEFKTQASGKLAPSTEEQISIQCYNGPPDAEHWMRFDDFRILQVAQTPTNSPEKLSLWSGQAPVGDGKFEAANAFITVHRPAPEEANGAAMVICPGGGYGGLVTGAEGHGIAKWLNQHGIAGIVLEYRLPRGRPFVPLLDAQRAIRTVRFNANQCGIDPNHIGIIGFSAGGHLASTAGTHFDGGNPKAADPIDRVSCRPDFAILVYPVITMGKLTHGGSKANLLGRDPKPEMVDLFSNEKQVTERTPPMFLAHAKDDTLVVPDHSRMMYEALKAHRVAAEYLELPNGGHGLNGYKGPMWDTWQTKSLQWLTAAEAHPLRMRPVRSVHVPTAVDVDRLAGNED